MSFPTGDTTASGDFLRFRTLENTLLERHPDLTGRVEFNDFDPLLLKVTLSGERSVVLARVNFERRTAWTIVGPTPHSEPSVWALDTSVDVLADALHAHAAAHILGTPVPSPLRWDEGETSDMTRLADLLDAAGVRVRRVVAGNRWFAKGSRGAPELELVGESAGVYVDAELADSFVRISVKPATGWLVDAYIRDLGAWGRLDLAHALWGRQAAVPGVPTTEVTVEEMADLIGKGLDRWNDSFPWKLTIRSTNPGSIPSNQQHALFPVEAPEPIHRTLFEDAPPPDTGVSTTASRDIARTVVDQLTVLGFGNVHLGDSVAPVRSHGYDVQLRDGVRKDVSLAELERLNGLAAASGEEVPKRLILVTDTGISRQAAVFADRAKAFVFRIDRSTARLTPLTGRTRQVMLPDTAPPDHDLDPW
ncbi:hypothetical protein [Nocardiopsis ansamitocini]|uniref:hypothetical protein n=1 Tax=Nocardiopsis ansamitocini TaxID=1670832 RepID=UPI0025544C4B|nr:hypothetical protein [Nocardiopsis ansamitocini]